VQQSTPALVSAASGVLPLGEITVTLPVSVSNVANLGAVTVQLAFDNTLIAPVQCSVNRDAFDLRFCNLQYTGRPDTIAFALTSTSGVTTTGAAPVLLVDVTWAVTSTAIVDAVSPLTITVTSLADTFGVPQPFTTQNGQIVIAAATPAPTATSAPTATPKPPATSTPIPTSPTTPESTPTGAIFLPVVASP
jgi:hypothetical protein